jgi:hypothetical protein
MMPIYLGGSRIDSLKLGGTNIGAGYLGTVQVFGGADPTPPVDDPSTIAGLTLWLDASDLTGYADGDPVATWPDRSVNGHDGTAPSGNEPLYRTSGVGGQPALDFVNAADYYQFSITNAARYWTFFFVVDADNPSHAGLSYLWDTQTGRIILAQREDTGVIAYYASATWRRTATAPAAGEQVYEFNLAAGGTANIYRDKTALTAGLAYDDRAIGGVSRLGSAHNSNANFFDGRIAEVILYNSALGTTDRDTIYTYLADKYGFTFP